ncbi:hypothetical protein GE09DRAFT_607404 [Coniochaeta sp. 2T2.1]|nr:hypothetical protein GE09DRAFT_607404 [Coniochaeta sp. 2T2.1]
MNDPPLLQPALGYRASQLRSTSGSPTRQRHNNNDDLLSRLTPRTAVDSLRNPSGELKRCMNTASPSEQAFAMRVAVASNNIQEWLEELSAWPWPTHDTSAGFERPPAKRRKLFEKSATDNGLDKQEADDKTYLGSLLASEVARYETRIREIGQDMEELNVEEIKSHILHNHIMPLSRPGTPMSDSFRASTMSMSTYAHMDDFTALITATIVQALPNLSKLTRLLNMWSVRLVVLRKSSAFLTALMDAEVALKAGWKAMGPRPDDAGGGDAERKDGEKKPTSGSVLSRSEFDMMKLVVERKVAKAGQYLDFMLDAMEGREDTLPEDWIDRMDAVEQDYAEWAAACERQIREAEYGRIVGDPRAGRGDSATDVTEEGSDASGLPRKALSTVAERGDDGTSGASETEVANGAPNRQVGTDGASATSDAGAGTPPMIMVHPAAEDGLKQGRPSNSKEGLQGFDRLDDTGASVDVNGHQQNSQNLPLITADAALPSEAPGHIPSPPNTAQKSDNSEAVDNNEEESDIEFPDSEFAEPELPALPRERRGSEASNASTVVHGLQGGFAEFSSDIPDQGTPDYRRLRDVPLPSSEGYGADLTEDADLPSSPPDFRSSTRSVSVSFNDIPTVVEAPEEEEESPPDTPPLDASFAVGDDSVADTDPRESPSKMSVVSTDEQLQQQIGAILDSIPAKIRLASETPAINLNPPDFNMPISRPKAKPDSLPPRSYSSLSSRSSASRAGTPSFTLAPAKNARPRYQRGNQEIKLYHLSRSNGEPPIKLFIRCVGDNGERVMVRVGGGWADLGEYLKEYASHHGRRGGEAKVEVKDLPRLSTAATAAASPPSRPASAMDRLMNSPVTPLNVRKARRSIGSTAGDDLKAATAAARRPLLPKTPLANTTTATVENNNTPSSSSSSRSRSSSRLSWSEEDISLGMAGPKSKHIEMSEEKKAWVKSMEEKVRIASGDQRAAALALANATKSPSVSGRAATPDYYVPKPMAPLKLPDGKFGELGKVGSTKRLFRKPAVATPGSGAGAGAGTGAGAGAVGK